MKCFYHLEQDAVATCKLCGRHICRDCVAEVGNACYCNGPCEKTALATIKQSREKIEQGRERMNQSRATIEQSRATVEASCRQFQKHSLFLLVLSALMILAGVILILMRYNHSVFLICGGIFCWVIREWAKKKIDAAVKQMATAEERFEDAKKQFAAADEKMQAVEELIQKQVK